VIEIGQTQCNNHQRILMYKNNVSVMNSNPDRYLNIAHYAHQLEVVM